MKNKTVTEKSSVKLTYITDQKPGYTRKVAGKKFSYYDLKGKRITDEAEVIRINKLAIPPAYKNVWICPNASGHLQATGIDAKGRKQYRYHQEWRKQRDADKFQHLIAFGEALPSIRKTIEQHMKLPGLPREKVLAVVVMLLEKTSIRVGNAEYARDNKSFGLTTLHAKHVELNANTIKFRFKGKSGKYWNLKISDARIAKVIRQCSDLDGQELFTYLDEQGNPRDVTSNDVNVYLKEITQQDFTAKDFRTWSGTVFAAIALQEFEKYDSEAQAKKNIIAAIESVSKKLGNTPAICRKCYIHPHIINAYMDGSLIKNITKAINESLRNKFDVLRDEEILVLLFLKRRMQEL